MVGEPGEGSEKSAIASARFLADIVPSTRVNLKPQRLLAKRKCKITVSDSIGYFIQHGEIYDRVGPKFL